MQVFHAFGSDGLAMSPKPMSMSLSHAPLPHGRLCPGRWVSVWVPHGASDEACSKMAQRIAQAPVRSCPRPSKSQNFIERCRPRPTSKPMDWKTWKNMNSSDSSSEWESKGWWPKDSSWDSNSKPVEPEPHWPDWFDEKTEDEWAAASSDHDRLIKSSKEILQRHRDAARVRKSGKRGRSPLPQALQPNRPHKRSRRGQGLKRGKARCSEISELDGKRKLTKVEVQDLRYSQISCSEFFSCGRGVMQLVEDLLNRKVSLSAPFLRLTVFETTARRTHKTILRCIDNRRLFALKEYAKKSGKDRVMVNVNLYSQTTLTEVQRFIQNSDNTPGVEVRFRQGMHGRHF